MANASRQGIAPGLGNQYGPETRAGEGAAESSEWSSRRAARLPVEREDAVSDEVQQQINECKSQLEALRSKSLVEQLKTKRDDFQARADELSEAIELLSRNPELEKLLILVRGF